MHIVSSKRNERNRHVLNLRLSLLNLSRCLHSNSSAQANYEGWMHASVMDMIWRGSLPSLYHQWDAPANIAITSPLLTRLIFWLECSSSSSSSSHGLSDLHPQRPRNKKLSLKVSGHLAKTIPNFSSPVQIYLCYVEAIIKWFFCNHVKYINMHLPNLSKVNQLRSIKILGNWDGVAFNFLL